MPISRLWRASSIVSAVPFEFTCRLLWTSIPRLPDWFVSIFRRCLAQRHSCLLINPNNPSDCLEMSREMGPCATTPRGLFCRERQTPLSALTSGIKGAWAAGPAPDVPPLWAARCFCSGRHERMICLHQEWARSPRQVFSTWKVSFASQVQQACLIPAHTCDGTHSWLTAEHPERVC